MKKAACAGRPFLSSHMRSIEMISGQRFESFDAAVNGIASSSGYPEILFGEALREGGAVKFFEQAFDWANLNYVFYPYFYGRKANWRTVKTLGDAGDPLFTRFLHAGYAKVIIPVQKGFEQQVISYHAIINWFTGGPPAEIVGMEEGMSLSLAAEMDDAASLTEETGVVVGHYTEQVPTSLVYLVPQTPFTGHWPGLPDNSLDPLIEFPFSI